jgi:hypothetical protein
VKQSSGMLPGASKYQLPVCRRIRSGLASDGSAFLDNFLLADFPSRWQKGAGAVLYEGLIS